MRKTVYLLGAGASHGGVPIAKDTIPKMQESVKWINGHRRHFNLQDVLLKDLSPITVSEGLTLYTENVEEIIYEVQLGDYDIIDNYAAALVDDNPKLLQKLKHTLIMFYAWVQHQNKGKVDKRYMDFFASKKGELKSGWPQDTLILTWNYDQQIPSAVSRYKPEFNNIDTLMAHFGMFTASHLHLQPSHQSWQNANVIHLNGIAGYEQDDDTYSQFKLRDKYIIPKTNSANHKFQLEQKELANQTTRCLRNYVGGMKLSTPNKPRPMLEFTSSNRLNTTNFMMGLRKQLRDVAALVTLGYSFPPLNRKMDRWIFDSLPNDLTVYVHKHEDTAAHIEEHIMRNFKVSAKRIEVISSADELHPPVPPPQIEPIGDMLISTDGGRGRTR